MLFEINHKYDYSCLLPILAKNSLKKCYQKVVENKAIKNFNLQKNYNGNPYSSLPNLLTSF